MEFRHATALSLISKKEIILQSLIKTVCNAVLNSSYVCKLRKNIFNFYMISRRTQPLYSHAKLLRLPQQVNQYESTGFTIMGDVFTL